MKKAILVLVLIFVAGIVFAQTIVVSTFSTRGQAVTADDAESITELFIAELAKTGGLRVVDRTSLDRVLTEMRFQASDWSDSQKTARLGAALNAEFLVRGQINQLGQQVSVAITALDIKTLEVVSSSTETFDVNRIYDAEKDRWGNYYYTNIFGKMPNMAKTLSEKILDSIPPNNYFIGRWQTADGQCILEFRADGTIRVERYVYWKMGSGDLTYSGTGVYSFNRKEIEIKLNIQGKEFITQGQGYYTWVYYTFDGHKNSFSFPKERGLIKGDNGGYYNSFLKIR